MQIIEVAPLTKIPSHLPQVFSYFSARPVPAGALVLVQIGRRQEKAIVIETHRLQGHKIEVKSASYEMKPVKKFLSAEPILTPQQIKLALWLGQYYFAPPGLFAKIMIGRILIPNPPSDGQIPNIKFQKLILVPTIAQIEAVADNYPKEKTVILRSGLRSKQLNENRQKIASGEAKIIIGTRLAVFAPFLNLKEIIIEDEANSGHRSWDMFPHYRAHEIAQKLAEIFSAKLVFKSELLSVESRYLLPPFANLSADKTGEGRRGFNDKANIINPPSPPFAKGGMTQIIDLRAELREGNFSIFSQALQSAINNALGKKQQVILFINRRGAGTFVLCRDCGYVAKCKNCEAPLTYHLTRPNGILSYANLTEDRPPIKLKPLLICHHCGQKQDPPPLCPKCQGHRIKAFGSGTQRVEAEAEKLFKDAKILRLDSDIAEKPAEQKKIIEQFKEKQTDILVGTQMMLNYDLNEAAVVAIISADTLMHLPDFRSNERLFQTIWQLKNLVTPPPFRKGGLPARNDKFSVSGGGGILPHSFILQTYNPQNKILQMAAEGNFEKFYQQEIETREALKYPPFSQLIKLTHRHRDPKHAGGEAKILSAKLTQQIKNSTLYNETVLDLLGPSPAFIPKQKGKYVWRIVLKIKSPWLQVQSRRDEILKIRNELLSTIPPGWEIDVDPLDLL